MIETETVRATTRSNKFAVYAWAVLAWNVLVVLWGAYVRAMGAGAGCGNHWPTCNGQVLPLSGNIKTLIEFTHRATSGVALLAVVGLVVWAFRAFPRGHRARLGAVLSGVFIVTEALLGAGLVLLNHVADNPSTARGWSLSLHLINTFTLLAVLALTAWWAQGGAGFTLRNPLPTAMLASLMLLGVSGAIAALGDTLFPVTSLSAGWAQDFAPSAHLFVRLRVFHPAIAVLVAVLVLFTAGRLIKHSQNLGLGLILATVAQMMVGVLNLSMLAPVWMQLVHLAAADAVWIAAILFTASVSSVPGTDRL